MLVYWKNVYNYFWIFESKSAIFFKGIVDFGGWNHKKKNLIKYKMKQSISPGKVKLKERGRRKFKIICEKAF